MIRLPRARSCKMLSGHDHALAASFERSADLARHVRAYRARIEVLAPETVTIA
jgi:hypothetical protein